MSFERTSASIKNLSNQKEITLDLLFDMMVCVSQDVMNHNNTSDLSNTSVGDQGVLLKKIYNIMHMTLSAYLKNKTGIQDFANSIQERYAKLIEEMNHILMDVEQANEEIRKIDAKKNELNTKAEELQKSRGHLLTVGEECEQLQRQIDMLSDSNLDEKANKKKELETKLNEIKAKSQKLEEEKNDLHEAIDDEQVKIENIRNAILNLQVEETKLSKEENNLLQEKNGLEKGLENLKQKLKEHQEWINNYPAMSERVRVEHDEEKAKITAMINALNSAMAEEYLREHLFAVEGSSDAFTVENYPDCLVASAQLDNIQSLQQWFENMDNRINSLIEIYETVLSTLVNQAEKLTQESNS